MDLSKTDTEVTGLNYKVKGFMGIGLPKELFILASTLELGEPIGQGTETKLHIIH